jgi:pimeloyl-ACP methyl ester carboxylesterase
VLLHLDGADAALAHPIAAALVAKKYSVYAPDLRGTGTTKPTGDGKGIRGAADHNSAQHGLWIGRPLLEQWLFDVQCLLRWITREPGRVVVVGLGQAGIVALCAAALDDRLLSTAAVDTLTTFLSDEAYPDGTRMGLLVPGILRVGDVPHLAALAAPGRLIIAGGVGADGKALGERELQTAFAFTTRVYKTSKADAKLTVQAEMKPEDLVMGL